MGGFIISSEDVGVKWSLPVFTVPVIVMIFDQWAYATPLKPIAMIRAVNIATVFFIFDHLFHFPLGYHRSALASL